MKKNNINRKYFILFSILFLLLVPLITAGAEEYGAEIVYFDNSAGDMEITAPGGKELEVDFGVLLPAGTTIDTGSGSLELKLIPNESILKLSPGSSFELRALQGENGSKENIFALLRGKLRTLAARSGRGEKYTVQTPSAVCAVRGTEFINEVGEEGSSILVRHGSVYVESTDGSRWVTLEGSQGLNTRSSDFRPVTMSAEEIESIFSSFDFMGADPGAVPGAPPAGNEGEGSGIVPAGSAAGAIGQPVTEAVARSREYETKSFNERSKFGQWISSSLGGDIGTTTIDGDTYSKLVLSPVINADKFRMAFYLPIIYVDLFSTGSWYHPRGNNEWSFGTDQSGWQDVISDIWTDLWLKIRYVEYGDAEFDPFYFKLGNLNTMSLGHGALVYQFANDFDFPAVRRLGFNMGYENTFGFEVMVDDLSRPALMGLRLSVSPFKTYKAFEIGLSGVADIKPAMEADNPDYYGDPWFLAASLDMDFLEVNSGLLKMVWFADTSALAPIYRSDPTGFTNIKAGPAWDMVWADGRPTNFGVRSGLRGLLGPVHYSLEYRYWNGVYVPSMFNSLYGRKKVEYVDTFSEYLNNGTVLSDNMGIFGEVYWDILDEGRLSIGGAYHWPWAVGNGSVSFDTSDYMKLELVVGKNLIKAYGVHGSFKYERSNVRQTVTDPDNYSWFDAYSVFSGEIVFPLNPIINLAIVGSTSTKYDSNGDIVWADAKKTIPEIVPVLNIETRINY